MVHLFELLNNGGVDINTMIDIFGPVVFICTTVLLNMALGIMFPAQPFDSSCILQIQNTKICWGTWKTLAIQTIADIINQVSICLHKELKDEHGP